LKALWLYQLTINSWSCDIGDQGYAYLPYGWVRKWATEMVAITNVGN